MTANGPGVTGPPSGERACPLRIDILTLFPDIFPPMLSTSIVGRAIQGGLATVHLHNIRTWADNRHGKVDDRPFGGGPGMVMMCQPLHDAVNAVHAMDTRTARRILLSPQGTRLTQPLVEQLAAHDRLMLIAAHYEGVDERVIQAAGLEEISVGDYVLSGGELPAMILVDAVIRLLPGALGHEDSAWEDSFSPRGPEGRRLLDCPHYTRPSTWNGIEVPKVLMSGDHRAIADWRMQQMLERTRVRRPDLMNE